MSFIDKMKEELNLTFTENDDQAYVSSGSYCLDFFGLSGGMRFNYNDLLRLFFKAFNENKILVIKNLFYLRDIRNGLGERNSFRLLFGALCTFYPDIAKQLLPYIFKYGRFDDILVALNTPCENDTIILIDKQLKEDLVKKKNNQPISLLAKWLPSINTSSQVTRNIAENLARKLNLTKEQYRKTLSLLRCDLIIENDLRERNYTFDYEKVPGGALFKYRKAFINNDNERYSNFLDDVKKGIKKMNSATIFPYQIIREIENVNNIFYNKNNSLDREQRNNLDTIWQSFNHQQIDENTIVVRDGSGSMFDGLNPSANSVATSLAILFAEKLKGPFHNRFITFSEKPQLIEITGTDIFEKTINIFLQDEFANTNIGKVYELILNTYRKNNIPCDECLKRIVIISDMEFDACCVGETTYESFKKKFEKLGYPLPELIFWNVRARSIHMPVTINSKNVKLVSGASDKVIEMITTNQSFDPYQFMLECLSKYQEFDNITI